VSGPTAIDVDRAEFRAAGRNVWDIGMKGDPPFARAEVFPGEVQWGVRLQDRAPDLDERDLLRLVAKLLVWHVQCRAETIDVVLGRSHDHHTLVRVGGDYV
jgi:hypothetical protein